ncbi:RRP12-like protein [Bienertia sinuspersici]
MRVSLLPGLGPQETDLLFTAIIPALKDLDGLIQKKAYKVLSIILKNSDGFISRKLEELLKLMIEVLASCHFSAKRHRLDCLYFLIVHVAKDDTEHKSGEIISSFLTEIVLALKEVNKKARNRAYDILVEIGHACGDEERGGKKENLFQLFNMVAGGLAGETPHMISAAVKGLARLAYEFSDLLSSVYNVLPSSFLLLQRKNREIIKANLGLLKVLVAKSQPENLQDHLKLMVEGLLKWQDDTKNHFKAKIKHLLEMLVKKCGIDAVKAVMPEEHMKLLTNIRKIKERREKKLARSEWGHTKIFSDFDNETSDGDDIDADTSVGQRSMLSSKSKSKMLSLRSRKTKRSARSLLEESTEQLDDEPLDLLDQRKTRLALRSGGYLKRKLDSDDEPEFDEDGRLVIHEGGKPKREKSSDHESDEDRVESRSRVSNVSTNSKKTRSAGKCQNQDGLTPGMNMLGKLEPYAYWPLDRKMLSRRPEHRAAARRGMGSVVKMTKKLEGRSVASALSVKSKPKKHHKKK